jgi:hypothetical protein
MARFPCLVGEAYQQRKRQLILDEQLLLRRLHFDIGVDQPHRHLYVLAHCWGTSREAVRLAAALLNDCVCCCPAYGAAVQPAAAAAASLHLGVTLCGQVVQAAGWWRATGVADEAMRGACNAMLALLTEQQGQAQQPGQGQQQQQQQQGQQQQQQRQEQQQQQGQQQQKQPQQQA